LRGITIRDMRLELADLIIAGDIVVERGAYRMVVHSQSGAGADIADHGKFLTVWRRVGRGTWKIVRDCSQSDRGM
jgi:ketosteroid isomerase-like protein